MADADGARRETGEIDGMADDESLDYITDEYIAEFDTAFLDSGEEEGVVVIREDGSPASEDDISDVTPEGTRTYYGNRVVRYGQTTYWWTNGVGQPCGTGFRGRFYYAAPYRFTLAIVQNCGSFYGYRIVFTW